MSNPPAESLAERQAAAPASLLGEAGAVVLLLQAAVFMVSAEARLLTPLLPVLAQSFQSSVVQAGLIVTAYSIPYGLFQLVYGPLADRFGRQQLIAVALGVFALGTMLSSLAPTLLSMVLTRLATGAAAAGVIPSAIAYIGDVVAYERRQAALGRLISAASLGSIVSVGLGGVAATMLSWRLLFALYGLVALLPAVLLLRRSPARAQVVQRPAGGLLAPYREVFRHAGPRARALYLLVFIEGITALGMQSYLGAFLAEEVGLSYLLISGLLALNGLGSVITARLLGRLLRHLDEQRLLLLGGTLLALSYVAVALSPVLLWVPLAMLASGMGFIMVHTTVQSRATELVPERRGTAVGLFVFCFFNGGGLGIMLCGAAIDRWGYHPALALAALALVLFSLCAQPLLRRSRPLAPTGP